MSKTGYYGDFGSFAEEEQAYEKWVRDNQQETYCDCAVNEYCPTCALTKEDIEMGKPEEVSDDTVNH